MQGSQDKATSTEYKRIPPRRNTGGGEIFRTRPDLPWGPPSLPYIGKLGIVAHKS
jgi:hypothetical protein